MSMQGLRGDRAGKAFAGDMHQPERLVSMASVKLLKHLHLVAESIENVYGDKSSEKAQFVTGVQGKVSRPNWSRDYTYFLARVMEVRDWLSSSCAQTVLDDLSRMALSIYNRFENRRRMGVEVIVLTMLISNQSLCFEIPEKYHSTMFVLEMMVSCRHRFQKPAKCYFWSYETENLLTNAFQHCRNLTRIKLATVNDVLLQSIAVHCRKLKELEIQFSLDASEDGLLALAGKSVYKKDQGLSNSLLSTQWPMAYRLHTDFGDPREWFVKDRLLFTPTPASPHVVSGGGGNPLLSPAEPPPPQPVHYHHLPQAQQQQYQFLVASSSSPPSSSSAQRSRNTRMKNSRGGGKPRQSLPTLYNTGFGCLELAKLRINGDFIFPPMQERYDAVRKICRNFRGPTLECGFFGILMNLKKLQVVTCTGFPMMLSLLPPDSRVPLKRLAFDRDLLSRNEFTVIGRVCSEVTHLTKVTPESSCDLDEEGFQGAFDQRDRHFSENVCHFLEHAENMTQIQSFQGRLTFCCVNNFFSIRGSNITALKLTTEITDLGDILTLRRFVPKLEILEGNFSVRPDNHFNAMSSRYQEHILRHRMYNPKFDPGYLGTGSSFSEEINTILRSTPMVNLKTVDIEGKLTMTALQLFVGGVEFLEDLHVTNSPVNTDTKAWSDEWLEALVHVNKMTSIKNITLRMVKDQVVESGSFSDRGLIKFLDHCLDHCQKITRLVGEFTKIPDKSLRDKTEVYARKGLRRLKIRNAVPYRKFENIYDAERYYGMNEGYQLFLQAQIAQQQQQQQQQQFIGQMEGMNLHPGPLPAAVQQQAPLLNPAEANGGGAAAFAMPPFHINQQAGEIPGVVMEPPPQPQEDEEGGAQHKNVPHKVNGRFKGYVFKPLGDSRNDEDSDG